jgi:nucleoside-diphosphate-sugar epimerase
MTEKKKRVLLTGASGSMGHEAFKELWKRRDEFDIVLLLLPERFEKRLFKPYEREAGIRSIPARGVVESGDGVLKIVWGDLTCYEDVKEAVRGVDHVLHPAALISPAADHNPALARRVNLGGAENLIKAIKAEPNGAERISIVSIGSVAFYGDRLPPIALIRTGDPLMPSVFDFYAVSKIAAERELIESGIRHWVSMRQTYIAIPNVRALMDPIMFHQPLEQCIEMCTSRDAGYGLVRTLDQPLDSDFWRRVYNQTGGPSARFVYGDYLERTMRLMGLGDYQRLMERNWFTLRNFHCAWYADSHVLNRYLGHQRESYEDHLRDVERNLSWYVKLGRIVPKGIIKSAVMRPMASRKDGPLYWTAHPEEMSNRVKAFYGSREKWLGMGGWDSLPVKWCTDSHLLDHGYDERKSVDELSIDELRKAAEFRGGECLSSTYHGDRGEKLRWRCAFGHEFGASTALVLLAGHWCPECSPPSWDYDRTARKNPFLAQAYYNTHSREESNCYLEGDCLKETF